MANHLSVSSLMIVDITTVPDIKCSSSTSATGAHSLYMAKVPPSRIPAPRLLNVVSKLLLRDANDPESRASCTRLTPHPKCQRLANLFVVLQHAGDEPAARIIVDLAVALELEEPADSIDTSRPSELEIDGIGRLVAIDVLLRPDLVSVGAFHEERDLALGPAFPATIPGGREVQSCLLQDPVPDELDRCVSGDIHCQRLDGKWE